MELVRHGYSYYPYELELASREARVLFPQARLEYTKTGVNLSGKVDAAVADRLVYYSSFKTNEITVPTLQGKLECINGVESRRQATRYSAHGLHEYKGKFNPQIARAILNIMDVKVGGRVIDPFCGSGTSLLECAHLGMSATGTDINPLAVFIANAKIDALQLPKGRLEKELSGVIEDFKLMRVSKSVDEASQARTAYLAAWFHEPILRVIERLRSAIERADPGCVAVFLAVASNLLRDYSQQDPVDLRIRRRKSPLPGMPLIEAFEGRALAFIRKLEETKKVLPRVQGSSRAWLHDSRKLELAEFLRGQKFDCALTSPPYATALPYIDTQRLSLVWLGLVPPSGILPLESRLVGSREVKEKKQALAALLANKAGLPSAQASYCLTLQEALSESDGFRRRAVPLLLYRYFEGMAAVFRTLRPYMNERAPFALIVGTNHTVLGGERFDIDTPQHLADLAAANGWTYEESIPLQTYQRYGYHTGNAITGEAMVIVRAK
ncbi:DNA methyltransferase [Xanthomonas sp. LMG 12460]|uniref:TRM11 family SAM-dependent methyltransferase n=1 Tax=Xanthomonas sp. LMG 12460 TaxID=1591132 RepID=UPI0012646470|nr:DNA methyltransferase [Xanthomonas sp. LMG 12460]KAB7776221.1 DNA methylase [Xanthomonas sp. LMG 12460]